MRLSLGRFEIELTHVLLAVGALSVLAVAIVLAVMLPGRSADTQKVEPPPLRYEWVTADRLVLPDDFSGSDELSWVPYRPRRERWTQEQINEYWLDPTDIGLDVLDAKVEKHVQSLLEEVP